MLAVNRIQVEFDGKTGQRERCYGTGFWLKLSGDRFAVVTNRHVLEPRLWRLGAVRVQLRRQTGASSFVAETKFFEVENLPERIMHETADVCVLTSPRFSADTSGYGFAEVIRAEDLADQAFLWEKAAPMDIASFIGFPGKSGSGWWDQQWNMAIARVAYLASWPGIPFSHHELKTSDVTLVSGLSFSGSSGSPVILHQKGIKTGPGLDNPAYVEPRLIGIMSGHWDERCNEPEMLRHTGLSYFTRSTAIRELLGLQDGTGSTPSQASDS
jgi:hypothetical protein